MISRGFLARAGALVAGRWVQDGLLALLLIWLARTDQSGYGLFVFGAGVAAMMRSVLALGLDQYALREFALNQGSRARLLKQMIKIKGLLGALILAGLVAFALLKGWSSTQTAVVLIIALGRALDGIADTFFAIYRADGRQVREGFFSILANLASGLWGVAALLMGLGVIGVAFFVVIAGGIKIALAVWGGIKVKLTPLWPLSFDFLPPGQLWSVLSIAGVAILGAVYNQAQIFLLKQFQPISEVALYGAAGDMAGGIAGIVSSLIIGAILFPSLTRAAAQGRDEVRRLVRGYLWRLAAWGIVVGLFLSTVGGLVLIALYGAKYQGSVPPLRLLGPATTLSFVNNLAIFTLLALRQEGRLFLFHLLPVGVCFGLGLVLIPQLGAVGAAWNLLAARAVMFVLVFGWLYWTLRRDKTGQEFGSEKEE